MKRTNKIISLVVTLAIILSSMIFVVPTAAEDAVAVEYWTAEDASEALLGTGTLEDPWQIASAADFVYMAYVGAKDKTQHYKLMEDIDLSAKAFTRMDEDFSGCLDGNGKTLTVKFAGTYKNNMSVFKDVYGYIKSLNVNMIYAEGVTVDAPGNWQGGFAQTIRGARLENVNFDIDCPKLSITNSQGARQIGLVAGYISSHASANGYFVRTEGEGDAAKVVGIEAVLENVTVTGTANVYIASSKGDNSGARVMQFGVFAGRLNYATLTGCVSDMVVSVTSHAKEKSQVGRLGGFAGCSQLDAGNALVMQNCHNKTNLTTNLNSSRMGLIIGDLGMNAAALVSYTFEDIVAEGSITGYSMGGILAGTTREKNAAATMTIGTILTTAGQFGALGTMDAASQILINEVNCQSYICDSMIEVSTASKVVDVDGEQFMRVYMSALNAELMNGSYVVTYGDEEAVEPTEINTDNNSAYIEFAYNADSELGFLYFMGDAEYTFPIAGEENVNWILFADNTFANGALNKNTEMLIETPMQLAYLAKLSNQGNKLDGYKFALVNDIDLADWEWAPMAASHGAGFAAVIDGRGNSILNMTLTQSSYIYNAAFIGHTGEKFCIKNVNFVDPVLAPGALNGTINAVSVVVGSLYGGTIDSVNITGMDMTLPSGVKGASAPYAGAFVGYHGGNSVKLLNSNAEGTISGLVTYAEGVKVSAARAGGLVGRTRYGFIENCVSNVDINVTVDLGWNNYTDVKDENSVVIGKNYRNTVSTFGGIVGEVNAYIGELTSIVNCTNNGEINITAANTDKVRVGGIVGAATSPGILYIADTQNNGLISVVTEDKYELPELGDFDVMNDSLYEEDAIGSMIGYSLISAIINDTTAVGTYDAIGYNGNAAMFDGLEVLAGARVRIDTTNGLPNSGLRFDAKVNKAVYDGIHGSYNAQAKTQKNTKGYSTITLGMMIVPVNMIGEKTAAELYKDASILKVNFTKDFYNVDSNGDAYYSAAIINLKEANYEREFVAIPYMHIQTSWDAVSFTVFGDINLENARSAAEVAGMALADPRDPYTAEQKAVLELYVA